MDFFYPFKGSALAGLVSALLNSIILLAQIACALYLVKWILL